METIMNEKKFNDDYDERESQSEQERELVAGKEKECFIKREAERNEQIKKRSAF